jgi:hypothetical protein
MIQIKKFKNAGTAHNRTVCAWECCLRSNQKAFGGLGYVGTLCDIGAKNFLKY